MKTSGQQQQQAPQQGDTGSKIRAFFREMGIVVGAFLVLNSFVLASFEVPTGSMENEIMTGDFLLVNKFVFGGTTPRTIPSRTFASRRSNSPLSGSGRGDVIVFIFPGMREEAQADFAYYLKRASPCRRHMIRNRIVSINGTPMVNPRNIKYNYSSIRPQWHDPRIFHSGAPWNEDNYGPIRIPKKGTSLSGANLRSGRCSSSVKGTRPIVSTAMSIDGAKLRTRWNATTSSGWATTTSLDSRFWGFIPKDDIIGTR